MARNLRRQQQFAAQPAVVVEEAPVEEPQDGAVSSEEPNPFERAAAGETVDVSPEDIDPVYGRGPRDIPAPYVPDEEPDNQE